jgi:hypothetical protein
LVFSKTTERKRKVKQESDWKRYYGSCFELKEDVKNCGKETLNREILSLHHTNELQLLKKQDCFF